jgi:hypothetical protein
MGIVISWPGFFEIGFIDDIIGVLILVCGVVIIDCFYFLFDRLLKSGKGFIYHSFKTLWFNNLLIEIGVIFF